MPHLPFVTGCVLYHRVNSENIKGVPVIHRVRINRYYVESLLIKACTTFLTFWMQLRLKRCWWITTYSVLFKF